MLLRLPLVPANTSRQLRLGAGSPCVRGEVSVTLRPLGGDRQQTSCRDQQLVAISTLAQCSVKGHVVTGWLFSMFNKGPQRNV